MYTTLVTAVALFVAPALAGFAISTPEVTQCGTSKISWEKTTGPYNLIVVDAENPCGEPLVEIGDFDKTFVEWKAIIPAGKQIQFSVADSNDEEAWSGNITVTAPESGDKSCLPGASSTDATTSTDSTTSSLTGSSSTDSTTKTGSDSTGASGSTDGGVAPVGAANAGSNAFLNGNSASAASFNGPVLVLSAIAAVAALAL